MKAKYLILISCFFVLVSCASNRVAVAPGVIPVQDRLITREDQMYGRQVLTELSKQYPVSNSRADNNRVIDVVDKLVNGIGANANPWQTHVLEGEDVINAAATRGNYIFVWTGMLRATDSNSELAAVIAHEIGHVLANHTIPTPGEKANEAITGVAGSITSQVIASQGGGALANIGGQIVQQIFEGAITNPQSQRLEYEADQVGIFIMAKAGYDPRSAVDFWRRLESNPSFKSSAGLEFLSTHPSTVKRIQKLEALLPEAERVYQSSPPRSTRRSTGRPDWGRW